MNAPITEYYLLEIKIEESRITSMDEGNSESDYLQRSWRRC